MNLCPETRRVQDYLDGELVAGEREMFESHLAGCAECAGEVALYRAVWHRLATLPTWDPGPALADRVLAEVLPRQSSRWTRALGWGYAASLVASLGAIASAVLLPGPRAWTNALVAEAAQSVVRSMLFVLQSMNTAALHLVDALSGPSGWTTRALTLLRAVASPLTHPSIVFTICAALLAGAALLWWMRPREARPVRETPHVGILGF